MIIWVGKKGTFDAADQPTKLQAFRSGELKNPTYHTLFYASTLRYAMLQEPTVDVKTMRVKA